MKGRVTWFHIAKYQAALLAEHINANYAKGINVTAMAYDECSLTPWNTCVSSKNISPDPYYCHSRPLAVASWVKCTCIPAVHGCTPTALQADFTLRATGDSQLFKLLKRFLLFPTITESSRSEKEQSTLNGVMRIPYLGDWPESDFPWNL